MLAAVGSQVATLHRISVGGLSLGSLPEAEWRFLSGQEMQRVFEGPSTEQILAGAATAAPAAPSAATAIVHGVGSGSNSGRSSSNSGVEGGVGAGYRGASTSVSPGNREPRRMTKKEKGHNQPKQGRATVAEDLEDHSSKNGEEEEEDFGLLPYDSGSEGGRGQGVAEHNGDGDEAGGHGPGVRSSHSQRRLQRRGLTVRQGAVHDAKSESLDEQLDADMYDNVLAADGGLSAGAGRGVRKYVDEEKMRRRRDELRQMLPS